MAIPLFCLHCGKEISVEIPTNAIWVSVVPAGPGICPSPTCNREGKWSLKKPIGFLSPEDVIFLRCNRIQPWEGGFETA